ncbi:serine protease 135 precursor [Nasonia vitripennis]|uniref:Peptidase S1 domain-containing protein n=1 Tax=Nasonia vitripennis TaxID=7425 RepID=A0A7M6UDM3_NASVI|nr:serine protease 135 precursor [Nasonia vitripennis]
MITKLLPLICLIFLISIESMECRRIVGGSDGRIDQFPYQVSIRHYNESHCGAAIIDEWHILTAAHCVGSVLVPPFEGVTVHTGTDSILEEGHVHRIARVDAHPGYDNSPGQNNDIAVITLENPIIFDANQQKIRLPTEDIQGGEVAVVTGWGYTSADNWTIPVQLQKAQMRLLPSFECHKRLLSPITDKQVCALQREGVGSCMGDSGGPLAANGVLVGITSWGIPCGLGYPDVYTKVYAYKEFIESVLEATDVNPIIDVNLSRH